MLHYLKFFHRKKFLKRPQFYYYKLIESYGYMCMLLISALINLKLQNPWQTPGNLNF